MAARKSTLTLVPFDGHGNLESWVGEDIGTDRPVQSRYGGKPDAWDLDDATYWRPATPFHATLRLDRLERGRSAATFIWKDDATGAEYPMFGQWLCNAIQKGDLIKGVVTGRWGYAKRGANYSIELL
jgi:hypothetical protein